MAESALQRVTNVTRAAVLATRAEVARGPWGRGVGLLGRAGLGEGEGLVLEPCNSVHTWFMRFVIDVLVLDAQGQVLDLRAEMRPWGMTWPVAGGRVVVELPAGTLARTRTERGDSVVREETCTSS